jgi:hypothetical protein
MYLGAPMNGPERRRRERPRSPSTLVARCLLGSVALVVVLAVDAV